MLGVPVRIVVGPRDLENQTVEIARRDLRTKELQPMAEVVDIVRPLLQDIQVSLFERARKFREENTFVVDTMEEFEHRLDHGGGFLMAHWDGSSETEEAIKERTKATIRCIPLEADEEPGQCIFSKKPSSRRVIFARSY